MIFLRSIRVKYVKPTVHSDNSLFVYQPLSNKTAQIGVVCNLYGAPLPLINSFCEGSKQNQQVPTSTTPSFLCQFSLFFHSLFVFLYCDLLISFPPNSNLNSNLLYRGNEKENFQAVYVHCKFYLLLLFLCFDINNSESLCFLDVYIFNTEGPRSEKLTKINKNRQLISKLK